MAGPWDKYGAQQPQGGQPWAKYGGGAPAPAQAMQPPPMPAAPIPAALQQNPSFAQAQREGSLSEILQREAQPYIESAQVVGSMMPMGSLANAVAASGARGAGRVIGGSGKVVSFAEKFMPRIIGTRGGQALEGLGKAMEGVEAAPKYVPPAIPLSVQMGQAERVAQRFGRPTSGAAMEEPLPTEQAGRVAQRFGNPTAGRPTGARPPRPKLIEQMGGKPVEDLANSDAAVKEKMETSPEVTYGKYAKAHQGKGSRTYPEPDYFQEQGPNRAPWGGNFPHQ